jgi:hypothetical protein
MGDADVAQFNGIIQGIEHGAQVKYLMCFDLVIAKVFEKTMGFYLAHVQDKTQGL